MSSLRDDVADNTSYKEMLLTKAIGRKGDFYSVPNVNSKRHDQSSNDTIDWNDRIDIVNSFDSFMPTHKQRRVSWTISLNQHMYSFVNPTHAQLKSVVFVHMLCYIRALVIIIFIFI